MVDQQRIVYAMEDGKQAATDFTDENGNTKVTTAFDAENQTAVDMQKEGGQASMSNFKKYVESN